MINTHLYTPNGTSSSLFGRNESVYIPSSDVLDAGVRIQAYVAMDRAGELVGDSQHLDTYNFDLPTSAAIEFIEPLSYEVIPASLDSISVPFASLPEQATYALNFSTTTRDFWSARFTSTWRLASGSEALALDLPPDFAILADAGSVLVGVDTARSSGSYVTRTVRR